MTAQVVVPQKVVVPKKLVVRKNPGCLIQLVWFAFVGWWAGQIWVAAAWFLMLTVIGIPFGVMMFNAVPQVIALRGQSGLEVRNVQGRAVVSPVPQLPLLLRALYFLLIGWWLSGLWVEAAYFFCMSIIGLPIGFWMFDLVPAVVSLRR